MFQDLVVSRLGIAFLVACALMTSDMARLSGAEPEVRLEGAPGRWRLVRDGQPYIVRGVGGEGSLELLARMGGNSIRTWGDERLGETLDAAHRLGLTVTAGVWLGQVRQGFDWTDANGVREQRRRVLATVEKHRRHPALLAWALGNEMEDAEGRNVAVWNEINALARLVKTADPYHPTMTVIAELGGDKVRHLHEFCPDIDLVGINSYAGGASVGRRYAELQGRKPYLLTEFGPPGIWEVKKGPSDAFAELTSTAKADAYRTTYRATVLEQPGVCLGSYAFFWGVKQEVTSTWFSLLTPQGERLAGADALQELWTGKPPANRCPVIDSLQLDVAEKVAPQSRLLAQLRASDPEGDRLEVSWRLVFDHEQYGTGGDAEESSPEIAGSIVKSDATSAEIRAPREGGLYRLTVLVRDGRGGAATANVPLRVDGPAPVLRGKAVELPLTVYAESDDQSPYAPSGWMGNTRGIKVDAAWKTRPQAGQVCLRCEYAAEQGWGGVVWQSPANDWGDARGGCDLSGAKRLTFWARGDSGGEVVSFSFGLIGREKKFFDTARRELPRVELGREWKQYEIPVEGLDLSRIKTGFAWTTEAAGRGVVFYLDGVRWEK